MGKIAKREQRIKVAKEMVRVLEEEGAVGREARLALIQLAIPVGLVVAVREMQEEAEELAGPRYGRGKVNGRWGWNDGSIYLADQKVSVVVPRVRDRQTNKEVPLSSYHRLQEPGLIDEMALRRVMKGVSTGDYEGAAVTMPATFGIKKNSVSKRFIKASGKKLREFLERDLSGYDIVAVVIDGKTYAENQIVVALGVTMEGEKVSLGFTEAKTENYEICKDFLKRLINRGLRTDQEILFVVDGAKGLRKGIKEVFGEMAFIQRCTWHKRENVLRYLNRDQQDYFRRKMQAAYEQPTYEKAKRGLDAVRRELTPLNESAVASLEEGLEETLTLHRLGMFPKVGISFKTTNCLENMNRQLERYTDRVDRWKTSNQRQRWIASALIYIEPRLRHVKGKEFLPTLRDMMRKERLALKSQKLQKAA
jgi:transposase-like protein